MKTFLRIVAGTAALLTVTLSLTACDASPFAATVNGRVIKQSALDSELKAWASNPTYVKQFDGTGLSVAGDNAGATYSASWVTSILFGMIVGNAVHDHLAAGGNLPDPATLAAARAVSEIQTGWNQFSPAFRQTLVQRLADQSALGSVNVAITTLQQVYQQYQPFFFNQVCVLLSDAPTLADAETISATGGQNGASICFAPADLEPYPDAFRTAVMTTAVGQTSQPIQTALGFQVIRVVSRAEQGFTTQVQLVLSTAIDRAQGTVNQDLAQLMAVARVKVNPAYGSWSSGQLSPPPQPPA